MELQLLDAAIHALGVIFQAERLLFLVAGVVMGLVIGVIPGIGGLVGLSLLLPFTFSMDPYSAIAIMLGLASVTTTGDTLPAVMFGVPGTVGSAATVLDGYPLAQKGEAGRALGASFAANLFGGLFGALCLGLSVPILKPIVLSIASPELVAICVLGLSLVAVLAGGAMLKGLAAAAIGLLLATTGEDVNTGQMRWTFDTLYLWDGLPVVPVSLGLFALPELCDLAISRNKIASQGGERMSVTRGQWQGVRDVMKNWFLVMRCSFIGAFLGSVPGIGASVIDWIAYGHAAQTERKDANFGKGDIRGVIASEASNNAKEGGALVPTIAFGVPGSASMALLLSAFLVHDIAPGPQMLTTRLDVTYTLVWSVAFANVLGTGICFLLADKLARLAEIRMGILMPVILGIVFTGVYQASRSWGDFYVMIGIGLLGWVMKRQGWPRPPLVLGFVLGPLIENYMFISFQRYGNDWVIQPVVFTILAVSVVLILYPIVKSALSTVGNAGLRFGLRSENFLKFSTFFTFLIFAVFLWAFLTAMGWSARASLVPTIICGAGLLFTGTQLIFDLFVVPRSAEATGPRNVFDTPTPFSGLTTGVMLARAGVFLAWVLVALVLAAFIGLLPAVLVFMLAYMRIQGKEHWSTIFAVAVPVWLAQWALFQLLLKVHWPISLLGAAVPSLRSQFGIF